MDTFELFQRLALALAIGLLIGLERGWVTRDEPDGERVAGLRTLALSSLLGGVWGAIGLKAGDAGIIVLGVAFAVLGAAILVFRLREAVRDGTFGATTVVAALLAFSLGALAVIGDMAAAAAAGVATTALLALKPALHGWVRRLTWLELRSALALLAMTFILLPILPNRPIDPWATINPFEIWLMTVMIGVLSFAGYVAIKLTGERRGIVLTGLAGGLASSTAATLTLARLALGNRQRVDLLAGGALLAGATMMSRVLLVVALAQAALLDHVVAPLVAATVATTVAGMALIARRSAGPDEATAMGLGNPLDLAAVLKFGGLLTAVGLLTHLATRVAGSGGAYTLAALSGIADVDAITLSMARLGGSGAISLDVAGLAVLIAVAVNTISKAVIGWAAGGRDFGMRMAIAAGLAVACGTVGYAFGPVPLASLLR